MNIYESLNINQQEAVLCTEGPVLILAGAGSGKTRVLAHRIAYLIEEKNVNPWNILAITFTNKAAGEMRERVDKIVTYGSESIWVSTFHSACVRILRRYIDRIGFDNKFTIYDTDDQKTVMKDVCKRLEVDTKTYKEASFLAAISKAKDQMITPEEYFVNAGGDMAQKKIAEVYKEYQTQLRKNNALDFDDLLCMTVQLFQTNPEVLESYQNRFRYIMVDEYQDTNMVQFQFIHLLAQKYKNLCVVGDDDQSIYKFRGANIQNILGFEQIFPDTKVIKLEQNYRSTGNILDAANTVIENNTARKKKTLWTEQGEGEKIRVIQCETANDEAEMIVQEIKERVDKEEFCYKDCALLYRTNAQSRILEEQFIKANIPYKVIGGINFYARKEIKDLLSYLKTIENGKDDLAVRRIINVPKRGIGSTTIDKIQDYALAHDISFFEALKIADKIPTIGRSVVKLEGFVNLIRVFQSKIGYISLTELLEEIIKETGYRIELEAEGTEEALGRLENIDELISKMADYEENTEDASLSGFLEEVALIADVDNLDDTTDYVVLMTLHSAKGLEFPKVFLCGLEDGLFPSYLSVTSDDPSDLEEERRLCYVGITRAMESLTISAAKQRMYRGETQYRKPSRFLKEVPKRVVEGITREPKIKEMPRNNIYYSAREAFRAKPFESKTLSGNKLEYEIGDRVFHIKFGTGIVLDIKAGGRDYEVTVDFEKAGTKKMFASFAKLKKLD
ncbi:MAG: DNA helicase PcrA [Lachnospiraceae bacterium]|jgi:DNA helicase-2/ATP-dependent DNA helicase PcrA|nr:DNA helicase PcrA [Lachnospiraceae bacterium]